MSSETRLWRLARWLERQPWLHRPLVCGIQLAIFAAAGVAAFLLRFDYRIPESEYLHAAWALAVWVVVKSVVFRMAGLHRGWWRFVSISDVAGIAWPGNCSRWVSRPRSTSTRLCTGRSYTAVSRGRASFR